MDRAESLAKELGALTITLNTLDAAMAESEAFWKEFGLPYDPKARINEKWCAFSLVFLFLPFFFFWKDLCGCLRQI